MKIKELRELNSQSLKDVAERLKIPYTTYRNYEIGRNEPNIENLCKLADLYNVSVDYILGRNINEFGYLSDQERALIESFRKLNEVNQIKASSYILGILSVQE